MVRYGCLSCAQLREESRADDSDSASDDETNDLTESSKHDVIERKLARQNSELRERDCELKQVRESLREKTSEAEALQRKLSAANRELLQLAQLEQSVEDAQQQRDEVTSRVGKLQQECDALRAASVEVSFTWSTFERHLSLDLHCVTSFNVVACRAAKLLGNSKCS